MFLCIWVSVPMSLGCVVMTSLVQILRNTRGIGAGVKGSCESPDMVSGFQTWTFCKSSTCS